MSNENNPQMKNKADAAQQIPSKPSERNYAFEPVGTSASTTPVPSNSSLYSFNASTARTDAPEDHDDLRSKTREVPDIMSVVGPHVMNYAGTGRIWSHEVSAKMRADAAAMKKAAEEEEAKAETTTTRPESKHDSMDPQREVVNAIRSTKTTEVKKKRWFRRIF